MSGRLARWPGRHWWLLLAVVGVGLALRLVVWHWHEFYPLGGDEQEYLQQALTLLREQRYTELRLMRPPLYGVFLAALIYVGDSLVQYLRLVQAILSALTVVPVYLLTAALLRHERRPEGAAPSRGVPLVAALLCALSYTLADYATELLTETLFLAGLTLVLWLLVRAGARTGQATGSALLAGLGLGLLCLTRSVALVLLPLGVLWLLICWLHQGRPAAWWRSPPLLFGLLALLVIVPWTARNYAVYGAPILIDTTGAENLWLDNDPAGREAVKAQLYALGDDQATRQQLALQRGIEAITADPLRFGGKAWGELLAFVALEYTDDMRARPEIWVPPAEVGARLLLGDGLWLLVLLAGVVGLGAFPAAQRPGGGWLARLADPRWLLGAWALYTLLTALVFHVELRYRLPLYPVLLPYAAWVLVAVGQRVAGGRRALQRRGLAAGSILAALLLVLVLLHRPYLSLGWHLAWKHWHLARAEQSLEAGVPQAAISNLRTALEHDPSSVLARVALARVWLQRGNLPGALAHLRDALALLPNHPLPNLLEGDIVRQQGSYNAARELLQRYETATLQDVQAWSWQHFTTPPPARLDVGGGLDLGHVRGFTAAHASDDHTWRWTTERAYLRLSPPADPTSNEAFCARHAIPTGESTLILSLRLTAERPPAAPPPVLRVQVAGQTVGRVQVGAGWQSYHFPLVTLNNAPQREVLTVTLASSTFVPRAYNPASDDARRLGVRVAEARLTRCPPP